VNRHRWLLLPLKPLFTVILLLIVAAASLAPCCVYDHCADNPETTTKGHSKKPEGNCSPFFACASCSGFVWEIRLPCVLSPATTFIKHYKKEQTSQSQPVYPSFWQPPRVV
jgi:hypothetical protein